MKSLILIGGGGHCKSAIDVIETEETYQIVAITDQERKIGERVGGYEITADDSQLPALIKKYNHCLVTVGQLKSPELKTKLFGLAKEAGALFPVIISPNAAVSKHTDIGEGTVIFHHAVVNSGSRIGIDCIINTGAVVEHDTEIGDHTHIAPGAVVNGHCRIGNRTMIGSGSVLIQEVVVGDDVVIGAGSTVIRPVTEPGIYAGSPARKIK